MERGDVRLIAPSTDRANARTVQDTQGDAQRGKKNLTRKVGGAPFSVDRMGSIRTGVSLVGK